MKRLTLVLAGLSLALLAGCQGQADSADAPAMTVYKSPTCGCCGAWVEHLRADGFVVEVVEEHDLAPRRAELGVPRHMGSCHTGVIDGYIIEGHVPSADIRRLLAERPRASGLAVPGMPIGSPGMEMGSRRDPYTVWLFGTGAEPRAFAQHGAVR